jgi:glucose-1-phosphate thymidylyltransferase
MTKVINKHLLPVFDKPMIFYPLTTLIAAGIREIAIVTNAKDVDDIQTLLGDGSSVGCKLDYLVQETAGGIPDGIKIAQKSSDGEKIALILGDNLLIGKGLGRDLSVYLQVNGCVIFGAYVRDPSAYGVVVLDDKGRVIGIEEKPTKPLSNIAIPGLYFFDESCFSRAKELKPSSRGELEIVDLLRSYLQEDLLKLKLLERGSTWLDCGTPDQLQEASEFIRVLQKRQGLVYGNPQDIPQVLE